uniref:Centromere protein J C-terminal domain-containing protein n=1 Tax=Odontella aurita TaxID=265563 RepID=A0A7S4JIU0_9STRA|mmetsp:Transcript_47064/g.142525  ORF Transcript_47064/g.142525 Transcript_47064/m.142525 type:complete len:961 (+) Transcript_47064:571-3453(+)
MIAAKPLEGFIEKDAAVDAQDETPPPPPQLSTIDFAHDPCHGVVELMLQEGHTFGTDTMRAMGGADEALANSVSCVNMCDESVLECSRNESTCAPEQVHLNISPQLPKSASSDGVNGVPYGDIGILRGQDHPSPNSGKYLSECSILDQSGPPLLQSSQRKELLRFLKCVPPHYQSDNSICPGIEAYLQAENNTERGISKEVAHNSTHDADLGVWPIEGESQATLPSTLTSEDDPLCTRGCTMTMNEMITLGERQMSLQQARAEGVGAVYNQYNTIPNISNLDDGIQVGGARNKPPALHAERKPFLRKGSRKEPTALHRKQSEEPSAIARIGETSPVQSNLKHLEKMQEDQIKQLEDRMRRRENARHAQQERKRQQLAARRRETGGKAEVRQNIERTVGAQCNDVDVEKSRDKVEEEASQLLCESPVSCSTQDENCVARKSPDLEESNDIMSESRPVIMPAPKSTSNVSSVRSPLKPRKKLNKNDENANNNRGCDEKWQVLKSMKRRQELALREAERERETARAWAASERESIKKWATEQRALIKKERHRAANAAMATQREMHQQQRQRDALNARTNIQEQNRAEVERLKTTIKKLRLEADAAKNRHKVQEKKLKVELSQKNQQIKQLEFQLASIKDGALSVNKSLHTAAEESALRIPRSQNSEPDYSELGSKCDQTRGDKSLLTVPNSEANQAAREASPKGSQKDIVQEENASELQPPKKNDFESREGQCDAGRAVEDAYNALMDEPTEQWLERHLAGIRRANASAAQETHSSGNGVPSQPVDSCGRESKLIPSTIQCSSFRKEYDVTKYCDNSQIPYHLRSEEAGGGNPQEKARTEQRFPDGTRVVKYRNGTEKRICADGSTLIKFSNGDTKTSYPQSGKVTYYYASAETTHTAFSGGVEQYEFPNGQHEKHHPDGRREIIFPDKTRKLVFPNGSSETNFADGIRVMEYPDGTKQIKRF